MNLSPSVELKDIIINKADFTSFIQNEFIPFNNHDVINDSINHVIGIYKFNYTLKYPERQYSLMGNSITQIFAYLQNNRKTCIYILIKINSKYQTDSLINLFGHPWNVLEQDYLSGDFDMLLWKKNEYEISLMRNFDKENIKLLKITNISTEDLLNQL